MREPVREGGQQLFNIHVVMSDCEKPLIKLGRKHNQIV